jgi:hypothetical protein
MTSLSFCPKSPLIQFGLLILILLMSACAFEPPKVSDRNTSLLYVPRSARKSAPSRRTLTYDQKIAALIVQLRSDDPAERTRAATELGTKGPGARKAIGQLSQVLWFDQNKWARRASAKALGRIGGKRAENALLRGIHDNDKWVRHSTAKALQLLRTPQAQTGKPIITQFEAKGNSITY